MKKILIIFIFIMSCSKYNKYVPEKPFIIFLKSEYSTRVTDNKDSLYCRYDYYDNEGNKFYFYEISDKYNVGDTIK